MKRTSCVEESESVGVVSNHHGHRVVIKDLPELERAGGVVLVVITYRRDIFTGELVGRVGYEETCLSRNMGLSASFVGVIYRGANLADSTITDDDTLDGLHGSIGVEGR